MERPWPEVVAGTGAGIVSVKTQGTAPGPVPRKIAEGPPKVETAIFLGTGEDVGHKG